MRKRPSSSPSALGKIPASKTGRAARSERLLRGVYSVEGLRGAEEAQVSPEEGVLGGYDENCDPGVVIVAGDARGAGRA
jgi:hypothetical protein